VSSSKRDSGVDEGFVISNRLLSRVVKANYEQYYYAITCLIIFCAIGTVAYLNGVSSITTLAVVGSFISFIVILSVFLRKDKHE
jgi:xanthine/uracil permease